MEFFASQDPRSYSLYFDLNIWYDFGPVQLPGLSRNGPRTYLGTRFYCIVGKHFVNSVWLLTTYLWLFGENWLRWAWWQLELDLEGPSSGIWREYGVDVEWFSKTEKNFSLKERKAHFLSWTQYSLGVELKFVECVNFCCWAWLKYAVTLKENLLNMTWLWWAWLKSLLTLIKNSLNVKTILLLEFCTGWFSIHVSWWRLLLCCSRWISSRRSRSRGVWWKILLGEELEPLVLLAVLCHLYGKLFVIHRLYKRWRHENAPLLWAAKSMLPGNAKYSMT